MFQITDDLFSVQSAYRGRLCRRFRRLHGSRRSSHGHVVHPTCHSSRPSQNHVAHVSTGQGRSWIVSRSPHAHGRSPPLTAVCRTLSSAPAGGTAAGSPSANQRRPGRDPAASSQSGARTAGACDHSDIVLIFRRIGPLRM